MAFILNGATTTPTSTFPYTGVGPIDYSQLNFVRTEQTDYYYGYPTSNATSQVLLATVVQIYDPSEAMVLIGTLIGTFLLLLAWGIGKIRKMGK
jgi:hypothetical protein